MSRLLPISLTFDHRVVMGSEAARFLRDLIDDLEQPINYAAVMQHSRILCTLTRRVADRPLPPAWKGASPYLNARLRSLAENR